MTSLPVVTPEDDTHLDCPVITKTRVVTVNKGTCVNLRWEIRDRSGNPVDISAYVECPDSSSSAEGAICGQVIFRFTGLMNTNGTIYEIEGEVIDAAAGIVQVELPAEMIENAGILQMEVGVKIQSEDDPEEFILVLTDKGFISVERGLFGNIATGAGYLGPPTINEIRMALRDTAIENQLLEAVEFDDAEIIFAISRPLRYWNETPPPVAIFSATNFPYHEMWLRASIAHLLRTAAYWYARNQLPASHGGIVIDDMNKSNPYLAISQMLMQEWENFVLTRKVEINASMCYGDVGSPYDD